VQTDQTGGIGTMTERIHPPATHPNGARR
jgi:hypothetical protein